MVSSPLRSLRKTFATFAVNGFQFRDMKHSIIKIINNGKIAFLILITILLLSCENKIDVIPKSDIQSLPSLTVRNFKTVFIDSGKRQLVLSSSLMEQYDNAGFPYSEFRLGIKVLFYDGHKEPVASVIAKFAKYTETNKIWELRDSVVVINEMNETLETELLNWSQEKDLIYTDRYVKITSEDQVIHGIGFESDSRLKKYKIKKVQATIYLPDEE